MLRLSKSKYTTLWQCPKMLWMRKYKPEEEPPIDAAKQALFDTGHEVGDLAKELFDDYVDVTVMKEDGSGLDYGKMISRTGEEMEKGTPAICEAAIAHDGFYCAVDILKKEGDGWAIYEVKSSTHPDKPVYLADVAFQKYVLEKSGINVTGTYVVSINNEYYLHGDLDIHEYFNITDVSELIMGEYAQIENNIAAAEPIMASDEEPDIEIGPHCSDPYDCVFWDYCTRELPENKVFDLYRLKSKDKWDLYNQGRVSFEDLIESGCRLTDIQKLQIEHAIRPQDAHIDTDGIIRFLDTLTYPLYFLDFETMGPAVPIIEGSKAFDRIVFQYSLHYIDRQDGELQHKEFLADSGEDPRCAVAEALCRDIPENVCVMVYNQGFERGVIKALAAMFPDLADHLMNIWDNIVDLLVPFQKGYYYNHAMGGSFSIKSVLPAVFPDDPELDYNNLEGIHNGDEAKNIFPKIKDMTSDEAEKTRHDLLEYCKLDTYAMVRLWQELVRVTGG